MGLLSVLFGRNKLGRANRERYFSIATAAESLKGRGDLRQAEKAGLVFNPIESTFFDNLESEVRDLLRLSGHATGTRYEIADDGLGTRWVVLDDPDFEDLVTTIHMVGETITDHWFGDRLLAAMFGFDFEREGPTGYTTSSAVASTPSSRPARTSGTMPPKCGLGP